MSASASFHSFPKLNFSFQIAENSVRIMQYLYKCKEFPVSRYPLFGSCVRALGKGWNIKVNTYFHTRYLQPKVVTSVQLSNEWREFKTLLNEEASTRLDIDTARNQTFQNNPDIILAESSDIDFLHSLRNHCTTNKVHMMASADDNDSSYDLISQFEISNQPGNKGVSSFTGNGKGKTTSALGLSILSMIESQQRGKVKPVSVIQWFKEKKAGRLTWSINEHFFPACLKNPSLFDFHCTGLGFFGTAHLDRVKGDNAYELHRGKSYEGINLAYEKIKSGEYSAIMLDEVIDTSKEIAANIPQSLVDLIDLQKLLQFSVDKGAENNTQILVTGRRETADWSNTIKLGVKINEVKHPWSSKGTYAVSGLDF
jgi:ATP:corrinoid adenosyltransferase